MDDNSSQDSQREVSTQGVSLFVLKLYRILQSDKYTRFVRWSASGDSFIIQDSTLFATIVLPIFFKTSIFTSFVRQLNKYDFRRISDARRGKTLANHAASAFSHPNFKQNRSDLLHLITRQPSRQSGSELIDVSCGTMNFDITNVVPCSENYGEDCYSENSSINEQIDDLSVQSRLSSYYQFYDKSRISNDTQTENEDKCYQCQKLMSERTLLEQLAQQLQSNVLAQTGNSSNLVMPNMKTNYLPISISKLQNSEILNSYPLNTSSCGNIAWPLDSSLQASTHLPLSHLTPHQHTNLQCSAQPNSLISPWYPSELPTQGSYENRPQFQPLTEEGIPVSLCHWYTKDNFEC